MYVKPGQGQKFLSDRLEFLMGAFRLSGGCRDTRYWRRRSAGAGDFKRCTWHRGDLTGRAAGDSQIIVPARERPAIDWDSCNRLAAINPDFKHYIKYVRQFCQTGEVKDSDWDLPKERA